MKSRSPSTSPPLRGRPSAEQSMERLSLRARRRPRRRHAMHSPERAASSSVSRDLSLSPPLYASVAGRGLGIPPQPQHEQELPLLSDRLPVINIVTASGNQKPGYPTSLPVLPPSMDMNPADVSRDRHSLSPPPLDGSVVGCGVHAPLQPRYQEEQESGSELDSPPRITFRAIQQNQEPRSPTSPPGSPPTVTCPSDSSLSVTGSPTSADVNLTGSPKHSSSDEEDPYFESLVDNFANAAANSCNSALPYDDIDYKELARRQCVLYAESALKHYNNDEKNEIQYELISAITCSDILAEEGCYGHVNFTAKRNKQDSMEELFFAELRWDGDTPVPTCVVSLEGIKSVGGLCESKYDNFYLDVLPIDTQHCYGCTRELKHPKNGELYEMGHVAMSVYYMGVV